jgi:hypothetical protein
MQTGYEQATLCGDCRVCYMRQRNGAGSVVFGSDLEPVGAAVAKEKFAKL